MNVLSRRIGSVVATAAVAFGLATVVAPAASAAPAVATPTQVSVAAQRPQWWCRPAHTGRNWRWDDGRRGGHWDKREWNRRTQRWEWRHQWRENRYCAIPLRFDGPPGNQRGQDRGPERGRS